MESLEKSGQPLYTAKRLAEKFGLAERTMHLTQDERVFVVQKNFQAPLSK
ncbi:MAG: hypothetical protein LBU57_02745 [Dysgonamonadaceae bacterium]|jgi:hypothetical protein|nr:hypothetical protein [Dysgonamonadaceae bacterium]